MLQILSFILFYSVTELNMSISWRQCNQLAGSDSSTIVSSMDSTTFYESTINTSYAHNTVCIQSYSYPFISQRELHLSNHCV